MSKANIKNINNILDEMLEGVKTNDKQPDTHQRNKSQLTMHKKNDSIVTFKAPELSSSHQKSSNV